ncbi:hypothetical protein BTO30_13455 [Domibacillus antri]|uniref:Uncharacterized protein n=1 Tax=Domibacillus antri TaxID=1714264 RepID=A0A1Q8Q2Y5_9BACI|nr:hypothetical protein [Domibacillus antri]OLN21704.1 hypothetical protein BTO30_13455 [Domibacillus antri]
MAKLYRRGTNFYSDTAETVVGTGPNQSYVLTQTFSEPGWVSFDFLTNVAFSSSGELGMGHFIVEVNGIERYRARASYTWTRHYMFVGAGENMIIFRTDSAYQAGDYAKIRNIVLTRFIEQSYIAGIGGITPPKPLQQITNFSILDGYTRYQRTGPVGSQIDFELVFTNAADYNTFIAEVDNFCILKYSVGVFGGLLIPQDSDSQRKGPLYIVKCKMHSSERAGVGVLGS